MLYFKKKLISVFLIGVSTVLNSQNTEEEGKKYYENNLKKYVDSFDNYYSNEYFISKTNKFMELKSQFKLKFDTYSLATDSLKRTLSQNDRNYHDLISRLFQKKYFFLDVFGERFEITSISGIEDTRNTKKNKVKRFILDASQARKYMPSYYFKKTKQLVKDVYTAFYVEYIDLEESMPRKKFYRVAVIYAFEHNPDTSYDYTWKNIFNLKTSLSPPRERYKGEDLLERSTSTKEFFEKVKRPDLVSFENNIIQKRKFKKQLEEVENEYKKFEKSFNECKLKDSLKLREYQHYYLKEFPIKYRTFIEENARRKRVFEDSLNQYYSDSITWVKQEELILKEWRKNFKLSQFEINLGKEFVKNKSTDPTEVEFVSFEQMENEVLMDVPCIKVARVKFRTANVFGGKEYNDDLLWYYGGKPLKLGSSALRSYETNSLEMDIVLTFGLMGFVTSVQMYGDIRSCEYKIPEGPVKPIQPKYIERPTLRKQTFDWSFTK